jgi:parallel beta-helix repeat protein
VCLCPGTYKFTQQLTLTVPNVTVKGAGANIDDATLDFSGVSTGGNDTMLITADGFTAENFAVKNTPGNGVVVRQSASPTFRKLHVTWDNPDPTKHGAYAVYPAECTQVLVEDCEVSGAADAAIYVGQGTGAILRRNKAHDSVLGIELENTTNGEAYDNETYNNAGGMAVFLLANLTKKSASNNLVHDNKVHDNNHANFGDPKTTVSGVPVGTGIIVVGTSGTEIRNNTVSNNDSVGTLVVSYKLMQLLISTATADPATNPWPDHIYIHDNTYTNNGTNPHAPFTIIGVTPLENVLWDGWLADPMTGMPPASNTNFCLGSKNPWPSFRMFAGYQLGGGTTVQSTDPTPYECDLTPIAGNPP